MAGIPREILRWLQSLDLTYNVTNPRRDFANGFLIAEIFARHSTYAPYFDIISFSNESKTLAKINNWKHLDACFRKFERKEDASIAIGFEDWDPVVHMAPNAGLNLMKKVYMILSGKELKEMKLAKRPPTPAYAKPTASILMKDKEL